LDGGFAEQLLVPAALARHVEPAIVPENVPSWLAALAEPVSCVLNGQERLGDVKDGWVVILGAGFIGRAHNAISRLKGARTVVVDPEPARLAGIDADAVVEGGGGDDVASQLKSLVGDDLAAIVVANSSPQGNDLAMDVAIEQTRILLFAGCSDPEKGWPVNLIHYKELELIGSFAALPRHVQEAVELLGGSLNSLGEDVLRIDLEDVPSILRGDRLHTSPKVVVELR
jgi:L-iditol 2-dehydrogenase